MSEYENSEKLILQKAINALREFLGPNFISSQIEFFIRLGQWSAVLGGLIGLLIGIVGAVKTDSFVLFGAGIGWVVLSVFFYYAGAVTLNACADAIKNSPTEISSFRILDAFGALVGLIIIVATIGVLYFLVKFEEFAILKYTIPILITVFYLMYLLFFPHEISTTEKSSTSAGNDALAVFSVLSKASLRLVPITFGTLTAVGAYILGYTLYEFFGDDGTNKIFQLLGSGIQAIFGVGVFLYGLLYPFISYLIFVAFFLAIDLARNILTIGQIERRISNMNGSARQSEEIKSDTKKEKEGAERFFHISTGSSSEDTKLVSESELHALRKSGQISGDTLIWTEGLTEWRTYDNVFR